MNILDRIQFSDDVKKLNLDEKKQLCDEIRQFLIESVSKTGGHLASNLGVVELTVALHSVFNIPEDKFVWDVGHQSYVNKILTGRKNEFCTLRKLDGLSGFPKRSEQGGDAFNTGHSSTSISAALGIARARDLVKESYSVGAIFGDGALTGGMMYEAMNDAGRMKTPFILILNDNNMSISKNVGSVSRYLRALRLKPGYNKLKDDTESMLNKIPVMGKSIYKLMSGTKDEMRKILLQNNIFENFGFEYLGPIDGNDIKAVIDILTVAKKKQKPVFIHVYTRKGKGYAFAEHRPDTFHGIGPFSVDTGCPINSNVDYSTVFGDTLCELAEKNPSIVGITAAMPVSTGMSKFSRCYRDRFFDVGIAEQHGVTMAAGMATGGMIPVFPVYSSFLQRAYDQILHDVCLQNLHVVFGVDRAGIVGQDGETHQGLYDISFLTSMPNMTVLSPSNFYQLSDMLDYAVNKLTGPVAIRYPRGNCQYYEEGKEYIPQKATVHTDGDKIAVFATGRMMYTAKRIRDILGGGVRIVEFAEIKPLDVATLIENILPITCTIEDGIKCGGFGEAVANVIAENGIQTKFRIFAFPDEPIAQGKLDEIDKKYELDPESIVKALKG